MALSLRHKFNLLVGILSIAMFLQATYVAYDEWSIYQRGQRLKTINTVTDYLIVAAGSWAVERGMTAGVLGANGKAAPKQRETILSRRAAAAEAMTSATTLLAALNLGHWADTELASLGAASQAADAMRQRVDRVLDAGSADGDQAVRNEWFPAVTKLIMASAAVRQRLETELLSGVTPLAVEGVLIRGRAWTWTEYAGRERGRLAGIVASGKPMTLKETSHINSLATAINDAIDGLEILKRDMQPSIVAKIDAAEKFYFETLVPLRTSILAASEAGKPYPTDEQKWFDTATRSIASVLTASSDIRGIVVAEIDRELHAALTHLVASLALVILALGLWALAAWLASARISKPIEGMLHVMDELASGNLEVFVPDIATKDEVGRMGKAVYRFKQEARANERYRNEQEEFKRQTEEKQRQVLLGVADKFEEAVGGVANGIASGARELATTASQVTATAEESATRGQNCRNEASATESDVEAVATAAQQLDAAIREVASQVAAAASQTGEASSRAEEAAERIEQLDKTSSKIREVIDLIAEIAEQTNLLALNATIEAARAGDAGKGFAVVASEVKALANQTQKATEEIGGQIGDMLSEIAATTTAVRTIAKAVSTVSGTVQTIASAAEEQSATTNQIAASMAQASERMRRVREEIEAMADLATTTGTSVKSVATAAGDLARNTGVLQQESQSFLAGVRA